MSRFQSLAEHHQNLILYADLKNEWIDTNKERLMLKKKAKVVTTELKTIIADYQKSC